MFRNIALSCQSAANLPPNSLFITPIDAGAVLGLKVQTTYNQIHKGVFPLPIYEIGGRRMVKEVELRNYIAALKPVLTSPIVKHKPRPGRPRKSLQIANANLNKEAKSIVVVASEGGVS
jgi:hypothetical protein